MQSKLQSVVVAGTVAAATHSCPFLTQTANVPTVLLLIPKVAHCSAKQCWNGKVGHKQQPLELPTLPVVERWTGPKQAGAICTSC